MQGLRKFIYSLIFAFLELILVAALKFNGKELNKWEFYTLAVILLGFPITNVLAKLASHSSLKQIAKIITKLTKKKKKSNSTEDINFFEGE